MAPDDTCALLHSSFYRFVPLADPAAAAARLRQLSPSLTGSIIVAAEGLSGTVAGRPAEVQRFEAALQQPGVLNDRAVALVFKRSTCLTAPFGRMKVSVKPEIVALALPGATTLPAPDEHDDSHLSPPAWRSLLARGDVVLLDNRNHFEYRLGRFRGAVDPQVHNFRDLVAQVQAQAPAWRAAGRPVAMYCTGGIRCDKTAPWLRSLGLQVWQLDGGILNYLQQTQHGPDDGLWQGECFVFDNRIALDRHLRETATTAAQVFDPALPDEAWRLARARRLDDSVPVPRPPTSA